MLLALFNNLVENDKDEAVKKLINNSAPRQDFFLMVILSILMATFGLLINNSAVIIGSMLIAPILYPILSLSLGVVMADAKLINRSLLTLIKALLYSITASAVVSLFFITDKITINGEILLRIQPSLIYAAIAVVAGLAASFALVKPNLSDTLPGIAISVALIPPIAVIGIGLAKLDWNIVSKSSVLLLINIAGIVFSSLIVFSLMRLSFKRKVVRKEIKKEEKEIAKEKGE